jgi:hypothetical protein
VVNHFGNQRSGLSARNGELAGSKTKYDQLRCSSGQRPDRMEGTQAEL